MRTLMGTLEVRAGVLATLMLQLDASLIIIVANNQSRASSEKFCLLVLQCIVFANAFAIVAHQSIHHTLASTRR